MGAPGPMPVRTARVSHPKPRPPHCHPEAEPDPRGPLPARLVLTPTPAGGPKAPRGSAPLPGVLERVNPLRPQQTRPPGGQGRARRHWRTKRCPGTEKGPGEPEVPGPLLPRGRCHAFRAASRSLQRKTELLPQRLQGSCRIWGRSHILALSPG